MLPAALQGQRNKFLRHLPEHSINPAGTRRHKVGARCTAEPRAAIPSTGIPALLWDYNGSTPSHGPGTKGRAVCDQRGLSALGSGSREDSSPCSHPAGWACCTGNILDGSRALGITALSLGACNPLSKALRGWNTQNTAQAESNSSLEEFGTNSGTQLSVCGCHEHRTLRLAEIN